MLNAKERFSRYLHHRFSDRSTPKHYLNDLEMFIQVVGTKPACEVTSADVEQFVGQQVEKGLSPATIKRRLATMRTFFEYMASEVPDEPWPNPVRWRWHGVKEVQYLPRDASEPDVARLFGAIDGPRDRAMFGLMVGAGLRVGEVTALRCSDLEAPATPEQSARLRVSGKGRKERIVWVTTRHPMCQEQLERTLSQWLPGQIAVVLTELEASGQAQLVERFGSRFWSAATAHYPDEAHSQASAPCRRRHRQSNDEVDNPIMMEGKK